METRQWWVKGFISCAFYGHYGLPSPFPGCKLICVVFKLLLRSRMWLWKDLRFIGYLSIKDWGTEHFLGIKDWLGEPQAINPRLSLISRKYPAVRSLLLLYAETENKQWCVFLYKMLFNLEYRELMPCALTSHIARTDRFHESYSFMIDIMGLHGCKKGQNLTHSVCHTI